jgi:transposase-like protein
MTRNRANSLSRKSIKLAHRRLTWFMTKSEAIAKKAGIELTAGMAARGCNNRVPPEKRAEIVAALNVNPNATAVAREVGGVSGVGFWKIAQVEGIELRRSCIDQARRRRGGPSVHHAFGAGSFG